jgi:hypothetical protein
MRINPVKSTMVDGLPLLSRPRRFAVRDLMLTVAFAALGMTVITLVDRSDLKPGERPAFCVIVAIAFFCLYCQWPISRVRAGDERALASAIPGVFSMLLATATLICLIVVSARFPEASALLMLMMVILVFYLTSWD